MRRAAIRRAIRLGGPAGRRRGTYLLGGVSALATALLIVVGGLIVNLLLQRKGPGESSLQGILEDLLQRPVPLPAWMAAYDTSLLALLATFLLLAVVEALLLLIHHRLAESAAMEVTAGLERAMYQQAARAGCGRPDDDTAARTVRLMSQEGARLRTGLAAWWKSVPRAAVLLLLLLAIGLAVDFFLTLYALLLLVFANWVYHLFSIALEKRLADARLQAQRRQAVMHEQLHDAVTAAGWNSEPADPAGFEQAAERYYQQLRRAAFLEAVFVPGFLLLVSFGVGLLTVVVGLSTDAGMMRVILLALIYARGYLPGKRLVSVWSDAGRTEEAAAAILDDLDRAPVVVERPGARPLGPLATSLHLEQVASASGQTPEWQNLSCSVPAGSRVAFASDDPHMLRALTDLLLRFADPGSGKVLFDGTDLCDVTLASFRQQVALAPVDGRLLSGTVADNIRCGRSGYSQEQLEQVAALSQVLDNIQTLPHGFHTTIGPRGRSLGADMAFRIGLARALLSGPSLVVVEEPREPADEQTRRRLDQALFAAAEQRTLIVLAARLSTLRWVHRVYLFHQGRFEAEGEHAELLKQNALYRHWNYLWFNPFTKEGT